MLPPLQMQLVKCTETPPWPLCSRQWGGVGVHRFQSKPPKIARKTCLCPKCLSGFFFFFFSSVLKEKLFCVKIWIRMLHEYPSPGLSLCTNFPYVVRTKHFLLDSMLQTLGSGRQLAPWLHLMHFIKSTCQIKTDNQHQFCK